jgi:uncharacterized repeat protein (TIGR01451 family)
MTPDGRFVAFWSDAADLVSGVQGGANRVYLRDVLSNTTVVVSVNCDGMISEGVYPRINADGRYVVFARLATDLTSGDFRKCNFCNYPYHIFRRDLTAGVTVLISPNYSLRGPGNSDSSIQDFRTISRDGRIVPFISFAQDLDASAGNQSVGTFIWRALPPGTNAELRVTSRVETRQSVMVVTLAVTNFGPDTAAGVVIRDTLSSGATFVSANSTAGSCIVNGGEVTCTVGTLNRRRGAIITLIATPVLDGNVTHMAEVTGDQHDPLSINNSASGSVPLTLPLPATLSIDHIDPITFINWLSTPASFQLEWTDVLGSPSEWSPISSGLFNNGTMKTWSVTNGSSATGFYRLRRP